MVFYSEVCYVVYEYFNTLSTCLFIFVSVSTDLFYLRVCTVTDLKNVQIIYCIRYPSLINAKPQPGESYTKLVGNSKKERNHSIHSVSCFIYKALHT